MFGISFFKLVVLVAVVAIVWYGFKYLQTLTAANTPAPAPKRQPRAAASEPNVTTAEDMIACRVCGTYVAANTRKSCGRADCIFGR